MHAAAPKQGIPAADQYLFKKIPRPPSLGEAPGQESFVEGRFSWFGCERTGSYPFLKKPIECMVITCAYHQIITAG